MPKKARKDKATTPETRTRFGTSHPERVDNPLWLQAIRGAWTGYALRQHLGHDFEESQLALDFSVLAYRDATPGPFWSWDRFGRTSTKLPDGRIIHIAGEHEDYYDPDFCIYNDVVVEKPDGEFEIYLYPREAFPPTDFHSATLLDGQILLIGSLGYRDSRRPGETQVLKFDIATYRFEAIATSGDGPGWISRHQTERRDDGALLVFGGSVHTSDDYQPNTDLYRLDLANMNWCRIDPGDTSILPVPVEVYHQYKSPKHGTANPEQSDNPFWKEMVRHRWPPSRARLHFGDPPTQNGKSGDVVWTAVRDEPLELDLPDGRRLLIAGQINDFEDERVDAWIYNDIIVTNPDGTTEIYTYPQHIFPPIVWPVGTVTARGLILFGLIDHRHREKHGKGPAVLRLDLTTFALQALEVAPPRDRVWVHPSVAKREDSQMTFPIVRQTQDDPLLRIAFDLDRLAWGAPYPDVD